MLIERFRLAKKKSNCQITVDAASPRPDSVALLEMMLPDEFFRDRHGAGRAEPALDVETAGLEIRRIECPESLVRENIDPQDLGVIFSKIRYRHGPLDDRGRAGHAG